MEYEGSTWNITIMFIVICISKLDKPLLLLGPSSTHCGGESPLARPGLYLLGISAGIFYVNFPLGTVQIPFLSRT